MTVSGKINAMAAFIAFVAGGLFLSTMVLREYSVAKDRLLQQVANDVRTQSHLQMSIYYVDGPELKAPLDSLLSAYTAIRYAYIRDTTGSVLVQRRPRGASTYPLESLETVRGSLQVSENSLSSFHSGSAPEGFDLLSTIGVGDVISDFTVPIFSHLNPNQAGISRRQFSDALAENTELTSVFVAGYVQTGISRTLLWVQLLPALIMPLIVTLIFIFLCIVISRYTTRRITAPFANIVRMADDIAAGRPVKSRGLEDNGEFKDIVTLLNNIIGGLNTYKTKMDVDHQLLSMKVEERTSQLSKRNDELNIAVKEVTETKNRLRKMAYYDSLTALPNRRLFTEQLDLLLRLSQRNKEMIALLFLDLDNFKRINDSLGHSAGDLLLREVAKRLARCVRESDLVAHYAHAGSEIGVSRLGGDEFTVVLNKLENPESARVVAERVISALIEPITIEGHELVVTPSVGIAVAPNDAATVEELLKAADTAMYTAKSAGKNSYMFYSSDMDATSVERLTLENDLRKAIENKELVLHYQPQVDTETGIVIGAEALMRWEHPENGLIPPFKFIPLAEELGLIGALGDWGLEQACRQMVELQALGIELPKVSVNVSALQFDYNFIKRLGEVLTQTGLRPSRLELELTEGIMMDGSEATIRAFQSIKDLGVQISVDDFGTGYSSLSYISRFPLDELKIDRSFVIDFDKSEADTSLVIAIIAMARSLRLKLVAEGVETHEQYRFLRRNGASVIQGYLFSKPVPLDELKPLLASGYFQEQIRQIDGEQKIAI